MAYRILYGTDILWEPYSDNTDAITDATMSVNVNAAKYLDFTMPPTHSLYNVIAERDKLIRLYANDKLIYKGYITKITLDMEGYKQVNCSSVMSYLGDTHVRDYSTIEGEQPLKAPTSLDGLFQWYIDQHNKHCMDSNKRFIVGVNQAGALDENNYVYRSSTQFPTTSSEIEEKILNLGGYIFERYEGDNNILDFYADAHEANTQILDFGVNITDFTHERSGEDQYTAIYATGYTPDPPEDDPEKKMRPISLADIQNGGSPYSPDLFKLGDILYSISGVQRYGYREYYYSNDDITTTDYLLKAAGVVLTKLLAPTITLDVKAVDMALFMENGYEHLQLGQAVRVRSKPHNIDEYLMISGIDLDLQDPGQTTYTIGATYDTLTGQQSSYLKSLNSGINSSLDSVAALDKATKENAKGIDEAKKDAANATSKANEASNKADVATNTANSANEKANEANTKAETATNTANSANKKANEASNKADVATNTANSANTKANEANAKAETATNTANSANAKADEAKADAANANTKADTATETANSANTKADEANTKADTATETANSANTKANEANTKADTATETANSANTKADEANSKADAATEIANSASQNAQKAQEGVAAAKDAASKAQAAADKAQADANANTKAVAQAQSAADAAKKAAADAQEKAENVESNLESANAVIEQHSNKLGELSTKVSNAVTNADAALTASTEAKQTATEASTTANTAYRDSQTAITNSTKATQTATEAKTTAESAVTTANDSLKQSSSAVQTANRIQNTLTTDYQTKADSDLLYATKSSLTETSESIKMEVSANYATKSTVEALQNVADNAIESWRGSGVPTSENKPASDWTTTEEKKRHSGDLYYDKDTGKAYRWGSDDGVVYSWVLNQDTDITKALQDASNAQKSANAAQSTANGAVTAAGNAQKSAEGAQSTADSAKTAAANAQKAADTVQTDVDRLKIDIPNTYATKASLETTANSITAQVESVSTTANSAVTAASKAQQTADAINVNLTKNYQTKENADNTYATKATLTATSESLSTSITKAQQTADGAVNAASNAQQTADAININLTKNYQTTKDADDKYATQTSLNATAESITSTVSQTYATKTEVTDAVDGLANTVETTYSTKSEVKQLSDQVSSTVTEVTTVKNDLSAAKKVADDAALAASKAQQTANDAKTDAATAQDDVNVLKNRVTSAETSIKQNSDSIALRATKTEVTSAIDGISVGGRNLFYQTKDTPIGTSGKGSNIRRDYYLWGSNLSPECSLTKTADGLKLVYGSNKEIGLQVPLAEFGNVENGDIVTLSFTYRGNISSIGDFYFLQKTNPNVRVGDFPSLNSDGSWHKYIYTFSNSQANARICVSCLLFYNNPQYDNSKWIEIKAGTLKLEKGNKPTDWSPAPEDLIDESKKYIDDISVGGRNYIANSLLTRINITVESYDTNTGLWVITNTNSWGGGLLLYKTKMLPVGVYSCKFGKNITGFICTKKFGKDNIWKHNDYYSSQFDSKEAYFVKINDIDSLEGFTATEEFQFGLVITNSITSEQVGPAKLELGNKSTDWSPAPEDLIAESKTYTDAQLKISSDNITSTVSKTYATKIDLETTNGNVTSAQNSADSANTAASNAQSTADSASSMASNAQQTANNVNKNLAENYTTTVDMNSKIEQTANSIKSEVSEAYQPKGDYAIKSEVDQTIEGVETKITTVTNTANTLETLIRQSGNGVEVAKKVNGAYTSTKTLMDSDGFYVKDDSGNNLTQIKPAQAIIGKTESKNVLVNSNGINIRNGENTIASFSENIVELGKNSKRSTIEMCGGSGSIYQENDTMWIKSLLLHGGIGLIGDNVWLRGNLFAGVFVGQDGLEVNHNENLTTISGNDGMSLIRVGRETINFSIHSNTIFNIQPNGVYINNRMVSDFVVAEGKCDFWTYRMWNSGIAECWGHTSETTVSVTSEWGWLYDSGTGHTNGFPGNTTASPALKFNVTIGGKKYTKLFTSVEHCDCSFISSNNAFTIEIGSGLTNLQTPQVFLLRATSSDVTGKFSYHAIGRWKA